MTIFVFILHIYGACEVKLILSFQWNFYAFKYFVQISEEDERWFNKPKLNKMNMTDTCWLEKQPMCITYNFKFQNQKQFSFAVQYLLIWLSFGLFFSVTLVTEGAGVNIDSILNSKIPIQPKPESGEQSSPKKTTTIPQGLFVC